jgi:hypothetical protein
MAAAHQPLILEIFYPPQAFLRKLIATFADGELRKVLHLQGWLRRAAREAHQYGSAREEVVIAKVRRPDPKSIDFRLHYAVNYLSARQLLPR